jgi:hypothetical protein
MGIMTSREETATAAALANGVACAYWDIKTLCADPDINIVADISEISKRRRRWRFLRLIGSGRQHASR